MALTCGIVGLTNTGKTALFNCISNTKAETTNYAFSATKSNIGNIEVPDHRLYEIDKRIKAAKVVPTTVEIVDLPGLAKGASQGEGVGNKFLADIQQTNAIIHVLRCFDDENLPHVEGSIDPVRDKEIIDLELQVRDADLVDRKIERLDKVAKSGDKEAKKAIEVLKVYQKHFEEFKPARTAPVSDDDRKYVKDLSLLTEKPVLYVCNVDDESAVTGNHYSDQVKEVVKSEEDSSVLVVAAQTEAEIAELEDENDRNEFLKDVGLEEPSVNKVIRYAYDLLNLETFFTAGPKEVRAWTVRKGSTAPEAAGVIHSDLQRGFIRAEVMSYDDFIKYGSEQACKEAGKLRVEGKSYIVKDGDILHIRFNV
ncbi:MAG: redox-regulated ATPase YchF [Bacteroidales bacterium]|nr:redox-regulated ATPase YchF [Bacteroidales bacterium]